MATRNYLWAILSIITATIFVAVVTRLGGREYYRVDEWARVGCVIVAAAAFVFAYIRYLPRLGDQRPRPRYGIRGILLLTIAVALLSSLGHSMDALILLIFLGYTYLVGPMFKNLLVQWHRGKDWESKGLIYWTSTCIVATFTMLITLAAVGAMSVLPPRTEILSEAVASLLFTSALFGYLFFLGDNARDSLQLVLYGLPIGMPMNVIAGGMVGLLLGKIAGLFKGDKTGSEGIR